MRVCSLSSPIGACTGVETAGRGVAEKVLLRPYASTETSLGCEQVREVSAKLMKLQSLFGEHAELDVAAMLIKEPRLAVTDIHLIARRLLEMRVSSLEPCTVSTECLATSPYTMVEVGSYAMQNSQSFEKVMIGETLLLGDDTSDAVCAIS